MSVNALHTFGQSGFSCFAVRASCTALSYCFSFTCAADLQKYQEASKLSPNANEVWGKVIFLHLSVILFTGAYLGRYTPRQVAPWAGTPLGRNPPPPPGQVVPPTISACWDTVNKQAVRILLEGILVKYIFAYSAIGIIFDKYSTATDMFAEVLWAHDSLWT